MTMQNVGIDLTGMLANIQAKRATKKGDVEVQREKVYDPDGNSHAFQHGSAKAWWDPNGKSILESFDRDPLTLLTRAGGNFTVEKVSTGYQYNGNWIELDNQKAIIRTDKVGAPAVLTSNVTKEFNTMSYANIVKIPDLVVSLDDFEDENGENPVRDMLQNQEHFSDQDLLQNPNVELSDLLIPWGCSVWQNGKQLTYQFKVGDIHPNVLDNTDRYEVYLTITTSMDGTAATKFFLTIVRVVCKNTNAHAHAQGWAPLSRNEKLRQSIKRTANMKDNLDKWHSSMVEVLTGSLQFQKAFKALSQKKPVNQGQIANYISKVFSLDLNNEGRGKRDKGTFERVLSTMLNPAYGQSGSVNSWLDIYNGVTAYIQHGRQVNNLAEGERGNQQREEKLAYKLLVEEDTLLSTAWSTIQDFAELPRDSRAQMFLSEVG